MLPKQPIPAIEEGVPLGKRCSPEEKLPKQPIPAIEKGVPLEMLIQIEDDILSV
jgi:hypothetical protein